MRCRCSPKDTDGESESAVTSLLAFIHRIWGSAPLLPPASPPGGGISAKKVRQQPRTNKMEIFIEKSLRWHARPIAGRPDPDSDPRHILQRTLCATSAWQLPQALLLPLPLLLLLVAAAARCCCCCLGQRQDASNWAWLWFTFAAKTSGKISRNLVSKPNSRERLQNQNLRRPN